MTAGNGGDPAHTPNPADSYRAAQGQILELFDSIDPSANVGRVPACPDWTQKDVLAHLVGLCAGLKAGQRKGLGSNEATAQQVATRSADSIDQIVAE